MKGGKILFERGLHMHFADKGNQIIKIYQLRSSAE